VLCAQIEAELSQMSEEDRNEFFREYGLTEPGLNVLSRAGYELLNLITYFTAGEKEVRAWTVRKGATAPEAAGVIHSDFEKGFIRAEAYHCSDIELLGSEAVIKEKGKLRIEGKDYIVTDGDVLHFRFNV
jgi:hypothetical protein